MSRLTFIILILSLRTFSQSTFTSTGTEDTRKRIKYFREDHGIKRRDTVFHFRARAITNLVNTEKPCKTSSSDNYLWTTKRERTPQFLRHDACYDYSQESLDRSFLTYAFRIKDSLLNENLLAPKNWVSHLMIYEIVYSFDTTIVEIDLHQYYFENQPDSIAVKNSHSLNKQFLDSCQRYFDFHSLRVKRNPNDTRGPRLKNGPGDQDPFKNATPAEFPNKDEKKSGP